MSGTKGHVLSTIEIEGAYLERSLETEIYMRLDPKISKIMVEMDHRYASALRADVSIVVRLLKALYGTVQAAALWCKKLSSVFLANGFEENPYDKCLKLNKALA
jgi:hypothetical protein